MSQSLLLTVIAVDGVEGDGLIVLAGPHTLRVGEGLTGHVIALLIRLQGLGA